MPAEESEMQRRHSSATDASVPIGTDGGLKRQTSHENVELIPTRTTKVATSKPAANPLQFIKVGPCNLYRSAQEQLKKVEEVKKVKKEVRDEAEEWQSNLDNWKCSRRKKQEHIIERVVEVKKLELEEHDRNRRRSKTFNEMLEDRNSRGRKMSLPLYQDDDNDLSDLGISSCSNNNSSKCSTSSTIKEEAQNNDDAFKNSQESLQSQNSTNQNNCVNQNGTSLNGHKDEDSSKMSSEVEEYTYERAIQSYVNYAETRAKSRNVRSSSVESNYTGSNGISMRKSPAVPVKPRRGSTPKIEEKLSELEQLKKRSMSTTDLSNGEPNRKSIVVPKVDINKRRELFEKVSDQDEQSSKLNNRLSGDFSSSISIRERLSSLGKQVDDSSSKKPINRLTGEISVKDRLSSIEKFKSTENLSTTVKNNKASTENILNVPSVKDRLSSLKKSVNKEIVKTINPADIHQSITKDDNKTTNTTVDAIENGECTVTSVNDTDSEAEVKNDSQSALEVNNGSVMSECFKPDVTNEHPIDRTSSPEEEIYESTRQQHFRHRSLDSLDIDSNDGLNNECFERVQSLEDLDFCRNYPASSLSGDTDREDSGIHTADVSSSVSQADDCDSHLDSSSVDTEYKFQHHPTIVEEITRKSIIESSICVDGQDSQVMKIQESQICVSSVDDNASNTGVLVITSNDSFSPSVPSINPSSLKLPLRTDTIDPLPVILECPSEPVTPSDILVSFIASPEVSGVESNLETIKLAETLAGNESNITDEVLDNPLNNNETEVTNPIPEVCSDNNEYTITEEKMALDSADGLDSVVQNSDKKVSVIIKSIPDVIDDSSDNCVHSSESEVNFDSISDESICTETVNSNLLVVIEPSSGTASSINMVEDNSDNHGIFYKTEILVPDTDISKPMQVNNSGGEMEENKSVVVCMREKKETANFIKNERRQTVIEVCCEKVNSQDLASPVTTPIIVVDDINNISKAKEKMETETLVFSQNEDHVKQDASARKESNSASKNNNCLKTDSILDEKSGIYNNENNIVCNINNNENSNLINVNKLVDFSTVSDSTVIVNKSELVEENNQINKNNTLPIVNDLTNFYLDNTNKLPLINNNHEIEGEVIFPLSPSLLEPPKEKPPPPPAELSDDDDDLVAPTNKPSALRRLDSTKRIKKEIRQKRSSFLGLEGSNDDSLEPELDIQPPPDMTSFLQEERRLEQMMYRQSICSESDSNQGESRDSGVELDRGHHDDISWHNRNHSRQDSEIFGNASTTSEEEENIKKEREIIDITKQSDQQAYMNNTQDQENIGEKLALRLRELEAEKSRLEWEREEEINRRKAEEAARCHQESLIQAREEELRKQETVECSTEEVTLGEREQHFTGELLVSERERLEREQEELSRQRESLLIQQQWTASLQDVSQQIVSPAEPTLYNGANHDYRRSMPNLQQEPPPRHTRPPPPIPPAKPLVIPRESLRHQDKPIKRTSSPQQMSRQTLQALSAAPRSRLISTDSWMQTKRKPKQENYNYQHWLIQEAEHRRITELQQRQANAVPPRRPAPPHPSAYPGQQYVASGRETVWQQPPASPPKQSTQHQQQWATPPTTQPLPQGAQWVPGSGVTSSRSDKPLPDSIIQTLTQRVQNRIINNPDPSQTTNNNNHGVNNRKRHDMVVAQNIDPQQRVASQQQQVRIESQQNLQQQHQEKMLSVSGKKKCSHCGDELGRGAAMIIETLSLFYHIDCFKCCVCCVQLGDGLMGTDVRVRNNKLHCQNCYSSDDGVKFSCV